MDKSKAPMRKSSQNSELKPIVVPIISENGVFEQDFEARMAVENLLKDVEFHVTGDDNSSEEKYTIRSIFC